MTYMLDRVSMPRCVIVRRPPIVRRLNVANDLIKHIISFNLCL